MSKNFFKKKANDLSVGETLCYIGIVGAVCYAPFLAAATWIEHGDDIKDFCKGVVNSIKKKRIEVRLVDTMDEEVIMPETM